MFKLFKRRLSLVALSVALPCSLPLVVVSGNAEAANPEHVQQLKTTKRCERCDLSGADLSGLDLSGARMMDSDLTNTNFSGANLTKAELMLSNASGAKFLKSCLASANLAGVVFIKANLRQADIRGANINGANFENARLRGILADKPIGQSGTTDNDSDEDTPSSCGSSGSKPAGAPGAVRRIF